MNQHQKDFLKTLKYMTDEKMSILEKDPTDLYVQLNYQDAEYCEWLGQKNTTKEFTLIKTYKDKKTEIKGDMPYLMKYFGYTLQIAEESGVKINHTPKTIKSLVSNIQKAMDYKQACCYERTHIDLLKS